MLFAFVRDYSDILKPETSAAISIRWRRVVDASIHGTWKRQTIASRFFKIEEDIANVLISYLCSFTRNRLLTRYAR